LIVVASVVIVFHLSAVALRALAAPSGPWPTPQGPNTAAPPAFALNLYEWLPEEYLKAIQMTHNYHFPTNRPGQPVLSFDVRLKDAQGKEVATVTIPDKNANFWVQHRQRVLANALSLDMPVTPPQMEAIPAPGKPVTFVPVWEMVPNTPGRLQLKNTPEHLVPRDRPAMRPSEVTMLFVHAYVRHLCRNYGATSADVIRHHRDPIPPEVLFNDGIPAEAFDEMLSNFGELK
jgi:hypothetical protein